jgi:hypothetical protein
VDGADGSADAGAVVDAARSVDDAADGDAADTVERAVVFAV